MNRVGRVVVPGRTLYFRVFTSRTEGLRVSVVVTLTKTVSVGETVSEDRTGISGTVAGKYTPLCPGKVVSDSPTYVEERKESGPGLILDSGDTGYYLYLLIKGTRSSNTIRRPPGPSTSAGVLRGTVW